MIVLTLTVTNDDNAKVHQFSLKPNNTLVIGRDPSLGSSTSDFLNLDSKVVSRTHAAIIVDNIGRIYIQDLKSSAGTFLNSMRLSPPKVQSSPFELMDGHFLQLGEDCVVNGISFKSVMFKTGIHLPDKNQQSSSGKPPSIHQDRVQKKIEKYQNKAELHFNEIWNHLLEPPQPENPLIRELLSEIHVNVNSSNSSYRTHYLSSLTFRPTTALQE